jgi:hypothetical protein
MALAGLGAWAKRNNYGNRIAYLIEAGDDGYDQLDHLLSYASKSDSVAEMYQWRGHGTTPKSPNAPFHAPDTLAWEWGKFWIETHLEKKRLMRLSFVNLLNERLDRYTFQHLYGEPLLRFFSRINDLGVEQMQEDRAALASIETVDVAEAVVVSEQTAPAEDHE